MRSKILIIALITVGVGFLQSCKKGNEDPFISLSSRKARMAGTWTVQAYERTSDYKEIYPATDPDNDFETLEVEGQLIESFDIMSSDDIYTSESSSIKLETSTGNVSSTFVADGANFTSSITLHNGSSEETIVTGGTYSSSLSEIWEIDKRGSFILTRITNRTEVGTDDSDPDLPETNTDIYEEDLVYEGHWAFLGETNSETDPYKEDQRVAFWITSINGTTTSTDEDKIIDQNVSLFSDKSTTAKSESITTVSESQSEMEPDIVWDIVMLKSKEMKVQFSSSYTDNSSVSTTTDFTDKDGTTTNSSGTTRNYTSTSSGTMSFKQE